MSREVEKIRDELAYEAAKSDLESFCRLKRSEGGLYWYDTSEVLDGLEMDVARALVYLDSVNMVIRNPERPALVRVKDYQ